MCVSRLLASGKKYQSRTMTFPLAVGQLFLVRHRLASKVVSSNHACALGFRIFILRLPRMFWYMWFTLGAVPGSISRSMLHHPKSNYELVTVVFLFVCQHEFVKCQTLYLFLFASYQALTGVRTRLLSDQDSVQSR